MEATFQEPANCYTCYMQDLEVALRGVGISYKIYSACIDLDQNYWGYIIFLKTYLDCSS